MQQSLNRQIQNSWHIPAGLFALSEARQPARPEMARLTEFEVLKALHEDEDGAVSEELARLMRVCFASLRDAVQQHGAAAAEMLYVHTRCPIERMAVQMTVKYVTALSQDAVH